MMNLDFLDDAMVAVLHDADREADETGQDLLSLLFRKLLEYPELRTRLGQEVTDKALHAVGRIDAVPPEFKGPDLVMALKSAQTYAADAGSSRVTPVVLYLSLLANAEDYGPKGQSIVAAVIAAGGGLRPLLKKAPSKDYRFEPLPFAQNLTEMAKEWTDCPVFGMDEELERLVRVLSAETESVVIVGPPGVGKTALVNGLVWSVARRAKPLITDELASLTFISIGYSSLMAQTANRGALEKRLEEMIDFFRKNRNVIPFFDEVHSILNAKEQSGRAIMDALKPAMSSEAFRFIGATTDAEYDRFVGQDEALARRMTRIPVSEPNAEVTQKILEGGMSAIVGPQGDAWGLSVSADAIREAVRLADNYLPAQRQPAKGRKILKQAISDRIFDLQRDLETDKALDANGVRRSFCRRSKIPIDELEPPTDDGYRSGLERRLGGSVKGQSIAIQGVAAQLEQSRYGWGAPGRPRARFLFIGPPGVGKTELAKSIAREVLFDPEAMVLRNMGEYSEATAKTRWMGSDPGYVGFDEVDTIYRQVSLRPHAAVVLDEFEKAHSSLANVLLSVLDGSGADSRGRVTDFSHCVFIMTSNAITELPAELENLDGPNAVNVMDAEFRRMLVMQGGIFTSPLVDRIDGIVFFRPLKRENLLEVLDLKVAERAKHAKRPLPSGVYQDEVRQRIVDEAMQGRGGSARGVERALNHYLRTASLRTE